MYLNFRLYGPKFRYILFDAILTEFSIDERKVKKKNLRLTDRGFEQLLYLWEKTVSNISFECAFCQSKKNAVPKQK